MSKRLSRQEQWTDRLFVCLQVIAALLFVAGGLVGYFFFQVTGLILGSAGGFMAGVWMRRSMGLRGAAPHGFYLRMKERADGSPRGLLELILEKLRGNDFTPEKCLAISKIYARTMEGLQNAHTEDDVRSLLRELDERTKDISYDRAKH